LIKVGGTATTRTRVGTTVPVLKAKSTLLTLGPLDTTVCRISVRCCVVKLTLPPC
jgi:hypothetical protein